MYSKVAVTGAGGYIGSVLIKIMLEQGYRVRAVDMFFFGESALSGSCSNPSLEIVRQDTRSIDPIVFKDCDCVIDLAALSNDPSGNLDPDLTRSINERGRTRVSMAAECAGVRRYLFASSCAVYGGGREMDLSESAALNPLTRPIITEFAGQVKFENVEEGLTVAKQVDEVTGLSTLVVIDPKRHGTHGPKASWSPSIPPPSI